MMITDDHATASEAYKAACTIPLRINDLSSPFVCPYSDCKIYAAHHWGCMSDVDRVIGSVSRGSRALRGAFINVALCESCKRDVIFLDGKLIKPAASEAPPPSDDMPIEIIQEYMEAAAILPGSPRGSAALLRLAVQKLLPLLGAAEQEINKQIGELVAKGLISSRVQTALDALRVIGNEAVHPGTIDLTDDVDIAMGLFRLLNYIIEKAISDPKHADDMFAMLPQSKRDAIAGRDAKSAGHNS